MGIIGVKNSPRIPTLILISSTDSIAASCMAKRIIQVKDPTEQTLNISL